MCFFLTINSHNLCKKNIISLAMKGKSHKFSKVGSRRRCNKSYQLALALLLNKKKLLELKLALLLLCEKEEETPWFISLVNQDFVPSLELIPPLDLNDDAYPCFDLGTCSPFNVSVDGFFCKLPPLFE